MSAEKNDLLESLRRHRGFLLHTVAGLTDDQARATPTASELCLGGLIKHVAATEAGWMRFAVAGAEAMEAAAPDWLTQFRMLDTETLAAHITEYTRVAAETDALIPTLDLDAAHPLPTAPWYEPGASWTTRRVLLHLIAETSQHAGHADILRESLDGQKTMG